MANDMYPLLLSSLGSGGSGLNGNAEKLQELLSQWNNPDQITRLLVQYLANNQEEAQRDGPSSDEEDLDLLLDSGERENIDLQEEKKNERAACRRKSGKCGQNWWRCAKGMICWPRPWELATCAGVNTRIAGNARAGECPGRDHRIESCLSNLYPRQYRGFKPGTG